MSLPASSIVAAAALLVALGSTACSRAPQKGSTAGKDRVFPLAEPEPVVEAPTPAVEVVLPVPPPPYVQAYARSGQSLLVSLREPEVVIGGLPATAQLELFPDGRVLYRQGDKLVVLGPDPALPRPGGQWTWTEDPTANDEEVPRPACHLPDEVFGDRWPVGSFWIDPDGRVAYRCSRKGRGPELHYVDGPSVTMGEGVILALGTDSRALRRGESLTGYGVDDRGRFTPVDRRFRLPRVGRAFHRADHEGFLVAFLNHRREWEGDGIGALYRIGYDAQAHRVGGYGPPADRLAPYPVPKGLGPGGELYVLDPGREEERLLRYLPDGGGGEVVLRVPHSHPWDIRGLVL